MNFDYSEKVQELREELTQFMDEHIYHNEKTYQEQLNAAESRWIVRPILEELKERAKAQYLWNLFLPDFDLGAGLTNLEYAPLCEIMGRSPIAPEVFNCNAPDTGNMEVLVRYGTPEQQEKWLKPLLEGEIRSCFCMTEPDVASSDATNIQGRIERDGDEYVVNGRKWWTTGAPDPRCKISIFMGKTDLEAKRHEQQSMILVPLDTPGVEMERTLSVYGYDDAPHGHAEISFNDPKRPRAHREEQKMATTVNTVTGQISSDDLGMTLMHEHFAFGFPGFQGDTLGPYDPKAIVETGIEVAEKAKTHGVKTIVDATPNECGRDVEVLREISERAEIQIICSTGYYFEGEGAPAYFAFRQALGSAPTEVEELIMTEITEGIGDTGIKAGVVKLASSLNTITDYEKMFFTAGAKAQKETGVPIITHTQEGTMAPEQAEFLISEGADPTRIMIGHMDGNTDQAYHIGTLSHGVNIAFDRYGIQGLVGMPMDEMRTACLLGLLGTGYGDRIMLSHDTVNVWLGRPPVLPEEAEELLANWHITHIFDNVIPLLKKAGISDEQINNIFVENPKRLFDS